MTDRASVVPEAEAEPRGARSRQAFCRVKAVSAPAANASVHIEVWMPAADDWNGNFMGTSNGGLEKLDVRELAGGVARGFATAAMDLGVADDLGPRIYRVGIGNPEFARNWSYRGVHLMTLFGKEVATSYYGRRPSVSMFVGSSGGGFQALGEAHRYPGDYDGIIAGAPSLNYVNMGLSQGYRYVVSHRTKASAVPAELLPTIGHQVVSQCDAIDGLADGIIDDPRRCNVSFAPITCRSGTASNCLSGEQVATLAAIYGGLRDPRDGKVIYPGLIPGAELSLAARTRISGDLDNSFINDDTPGPLIWALGNTFTAPNWLTLDFARADRFRAVLAPYENSQPDFAAFAARGGKLILFSGWEEASSNPVDIVNLFQSAQHSGGGPTGTARYLRLFMAPGMFHHAGGPGPNSFGQSLSVIGTGPRDDLIIAMARWVSTGIAPDRIVATKFMDDKPTEKVLRTRPLCPYPQVARWNGRGSIDEAGEFACAEP